MKLINSKAELFQQPEGLEGVYKMIEIAGRTCYCSQDKITEDSAKGFVERMIKSGHTAMLEHGTVYLYLEATPDNTFSKFEHPNLRHTAHYNWGDVVGAIRARYAGNPYSRSFSIYEGYKHIAAVTTNLRVIIENGWEDDLKFISAPTKYHEKRYTVKFTTDQGILRELTRSRSMSFAVESTRYCNYSKDKYGNEITVIIPSWGKGLIEGNSYDSDIVDMVEISEEVPKDNAAFLKAMCYAEQHYMYLLFIEKSPQQARQVLPLATKCDVVMTGFASDWRYFLDLRLFEKTGKVHPDMLELTNKLKDELVNAGVWEDIMKQPSKFE